MAHHVIDGKILNIFPYNYVAGNKYPTINFHHGIGENAQSSTNNTMEEFSDFHRFLNYCADTFGIIFILPQDQDSNWTTHQHLRDTWLYADQFTDGRKGIGGLSMGAGETLWNVMNANLETIFADCTFIMPICPPSSETMNELPLGRSKIPFLSFMGVNDAAVTISSYVNTIGDIIAAGRTENFYNVIYPHRDHFIWNSVFDKVIPASPNTDGKDSAGRNIYAIDKFSDLQGHAKWPTISGLPSLPDWALLNNPAIHPMEYFLMQRPGDFKPYPRLGVEPVPAPIPTPVPADAYIVGANYAGVDSATIGWTAGLPTKVVAPVGKIIDNAYHRTVNGKQRVTFKYKDKATGIFTTQTFEKKP